MPNPGRKLRVAVVLPEDVRTDPESPFLRLFRNNAHKLKQAFKFIAPLGTAHALERTSLYTRADIEALRHASKGGIIQIAYDVVCNRLDAVVFLYDSSALHTESPEMRALVRECIQMRVPLLTTTETAAHWLKSGASNAPQRKPRKQPPTLRGAFVGSLREATDRTKCTLALISHDAEKLTMSAFAVRHYAFIKSFGRILMTHTTGNQILDSLNAAQLSAPLDQFVQVGSGPKGGDIQIAHEVMHGRCQAIVFMQDPATAHAHADEISLLRRACQLPNTDCVLLSDRDSAAKWIESLGPGDLNNGPPRSDAHRFRVAHNLAEAIVPSGDEVTAHVQRLKAHVNSTNCHDGWFAKKRDFAKHGDLVKPLMDSLCACGAAYFDSLLRRLDVRCRTIAIMGGDTMEWFVSSLKIHISTWHKNTTLDGVVVAAGSGSWEGLDPLPNQNAEALSGVYRGSQFIPLPYHVLETATPRHINAPVPHIIATTIYGLDAQLLKKFDGHDRMKRILGGVIAKGAVGAIAGIFFDANGNEIKARNPGDGTVMHATGATFHMLRGLCSMQHNTDTMIAQSSLGAHRIVAIVGGDRRRDKAIAGAIKGGLINVLITDADTLASVTRLLRTPEVVTARLGLAIVEAGQ